MNAYNQDQAECRAVVRQIVQKLPGNIREKLISRIYLESGIDCNVEWELALVFDAASCNSFSRKSICDCLRDVCRIEEFAYMASGSGFHGKSERQGQGTDKVRVVHQQLTPGGFSRKHSVVLYLAGAGVRNKDEAKKLVSKAPASQMFTSAKGYNYYLLGFSDTASADTFRRGVGPEFFCEESRSQARKSPGDGKITGALAPKN
jgi:hypothetical protein